MTDPGPTLPVAQTRIAERDLKRRKAPVGTGRVVPAIAANGAQAFIAKRKETPTWTYLVDDWDSQARSGQRTSKRQDCSPVSGGPACRPRALRREKPIEAMPPRSGTDCGDCGRLRRGSPGARAARSE